MFASGALGTAVCYLIWACSIILLAKVVVSWVVAMSGPPFSGPFRTIVELLDDITEPVLRPLRRILPPVRAGGLGFDLSPMLAFVVLIVLKQAIGC